MSAVRERIHRLIDALPEADLLNVEKFLIDHLARANPVALALARAPEDDKPVTDEERIAIEAGLDDLARGRVVSDEELRRRLGL